MDLLSWMAVAFIIIGFIVVFSMKKGMEKRVAFIKENPEAEGIDELSRPVVRWVWGTAIFGVVSIFLVSWLFSVNVN